MALETLKELKQIDGFGITRGKPEGMTWDEYDALRPKYPIHICDKINSISFKLQSGPIKETGVNGCQVDTIIKTASIILANLNSKFPCTENVRAIVCLEEALIHLRARKEDREKRGVEGTSKQ